MRPNFFARFSPDNQKSGVTTVTTVTGAASDSTIRGNVTSPAVTPRDLATVTTVTASAPAESVTPVTPPVSSTVTAAPRNSALVSQLVSDGVTPVTPVTPDFDDSCTIIYSAEDWDSDEGPPILAAYRAMGGVGSDRARNAANAPGGPRGGVAP